MLPVAIPNRSWAVMSSCRRRFDSWPAPFGERVQILDFCRGHQLAKPRRGRFAQCRSGPSMTGK